LNAFKNSLSFSSDLISEQLVLGVKLVIQFKNKREHSWKDGYRKKIYLKQLLKPMLFLK